MNAYEEALAEGEKRAVVYGGSEEMRAALKTVFRRMKDGEAVKVIFLGASSMAGAGGTALHSYAELLTQYFHAMNGNPAVVNVTALNHSIGSTESRYGATRAERDAFSLCPDLLFVGHSQNDSDSEYSTEAYESILSRARALKIPVINCLAGDTDGHVGIVVENQLAVNRRYGVPVLSFWHALGEFSKTTDIEALQTKALWLFDNAHLNDAGHALFAAMIEHYIEGLFKDPATEDGTIGKPASDFGNEPAGAFACKETPLWQPLPEVTENRFTDAVLVDRAIEARCHEECSARNPRIEIRTDGWEPYSARMWMKQNFSGPQLSEEGWQTKKPGSRITFEFEAGYFWFLMHVKPNSGTLEIRVDGEVKALLSRTGTGYPNVIQVLHDASPAHHTVTLTLLKNPEIPDAFFGIICAGVSNFRL